jgi:hypothetical protein
MRLGLFSRRPLPFNLQAPFRTDKFSVTSAPALNLHVGGCRWRHQVRNCTANSAHAKNLRGGGNRWNSCLFCPTPPGRPRQRDQRKQRGRPECREVHGAFLMSRFPASFLVLRPNQCRDFRLCSRCRGLSHVTVSGPEAYPNTSAAQKPHRPRPETPRNRSPGRRCARDTSWKSTKGALSAASSCEAPGIPGRTRSRNRNARSRPRSRGSSSVALLSEATAALLSSNIQGVAEKGREGAVETQWCPFRTRSRHAGRSHGHHRAPNRHAVVKLSAVLARGREVEANAENTSRGA